MITLPCGAGKTIVGMACMAMLQSSTLILTTSVTAVRQWIRELLDKTTLLEDQVTEYSGQSKNVAPVTVSTYQIMTWRQNSEPTSFTWRSSTAATRASSSMTRCTCCRRPSFV